MAEDRYDDSKDHDNEKGDAENIRSLTGPAPLPAVSTTAHDPYDEPKEQDTDNDAENIH